MFKQWFSLAILFTLWGGSSVLAYQIAYEGFGSGSASADLAETGGGTGWANGSTWQHTLGTSNQFLYTDPGMVFPGLETRGMKVTYVANGDYFGDYRRDLTAPITINASNPEIWISVLVEIGSSDPQIGRGIGIELIHDDTEVVGLGKAINKGLGVGVALNSGGTHSVAVGQSVGIWFMALKLSWTGTETEGTVYVASGQEEGFDLADIETFGASAIKNFAGPLTFEAVNIYGSHGKTTTNGVDEIRIGDDYASVLTTPSMDQASRPIPANKSQDEAPEVTLSWAPGDSAVSHNLYFSTHFDDVNRASVDEPLDALLQVGLLELSYEPGLLEEGQTYYWRVDEVAANGTVYKGHVWSFWVRPQTAYNYVPVDSLEYVPSVATTLTWDSGRDAILHVVYYGTDHDTVAQAAGGSFLSTNSYTPEDLVPGTTYYWRVDQFDSKGQIHKGPIQSFTTIPVYEITDETLLGNWNFDQVNAGAVVDVSGHALHGNKFGNPQQVDGAAAYGLALNGTSDYIVTSAPMDVTADAVTMTAWLKPTKVHGIAGIIFSRGSGSDVYGFNLKANNQLSYHWNAVPESYGFNSGLVLQMNEWSFVALVVESEKATFYLDGTDLYRENVMAHNAATLSADIGLGFDPTGTRRFGGTMDDLRLYTRALSPTDIQAVMDVGKPPASPPEDPSIIESFNRYNCYDVDIGIDVWEPWQDGYGGNGTGSIAGYFNEPYLERAILALDHGQSLPLNYNNTGNFYDENNNLQTRLVSEVTHTFSPTLDLTEAGASALALSVRGSSNNDTNFTSDQFYLVLNDGTSEQTFVLLDSSAVGSDSWHALRIDLNTLTVNPAAITSMTLGIGNRATPQLGGTGLVLVDDIYRAQ